MKVYKCTNCHNPLYFENNTCPCCGHMIGFDPDKFTLVTLDTNYLGEYYDISDTQRMYRYCHNAVYGTCNWLVPLQHDSGFCLACELNRTIPSLSHEDNLKSWRSIEVAKHRLVYSLLRLHLPFYPKANREDEKGMAFDFLSDTSTDERILTGHKRGVITLNIDEADESKRAHIKTEFGEHYRTLLGHFRHETGHYYWDVLVKNNEADLERFRSLFGDERQDYQESLNRYYANGARENWSSSHISAYATAHPWEDWAETWAHYMHMMDALETAYSFGVSINPDPGNDLTYMYTSIKDDPYSMRDFYEISGMWLPLTFAVNSLNRSMGHPDFYPFMISPTVNEKLRMVHEVCRMAIINLWTEYQKGELTGS